MTNEIQEAFIEEIKGRDNKDLFKLFVLLKKEKDDFEKKLKLIKEEIADRMHKLKTNELLMNLDELGEWISKYQSTTRKNVDYTVLYERLGPHAYSEVVKESTSEFLVVKKAPKKKKSKVNEKPVKDDISSNIPSGQLA